MGGIIFGLGGKTVNSFAWGLRIKTNNKAKWSAFLHGLEIVTELKIPCLMVIGDSKHVIQKMCRGYTKCTSNCKMIYKHISHLNKPPLISLYHVKRENNGIVDKIANKGARNEQGMVIYANNSMVIKHVPNQ